VSHSPPPLELGIQENWETPIPPDLWQSWFQTWLHALDIRDPCEISLCFTDDAEIQQLNARYRDQDRPTDVLAFAAEETPMPGAGVLPTRILGDIIISVPTAERQARQAGHPLTSELAWLAAHGLLHLLGWDHPDPEHLGSMLQQQKRLLDQVQIPIAPGCLDASTVWDEE